MRDRPLYKLLLAAALVVGQWLAVAHDFQHPVTASDLACQVCAHGPHFQAGPAALPALSSLWPGSAAPVIHPPVPQLARRHTQASIRAPPADLV
jgi:hypothetical protein